MVNLLNFEGTSRGPVTAVARAHSLSNFDDSLTCRCAPGLNHSEPFGVFTYRAQTQHPVERALHLGCVATGALTSPLVRLSPIERVFGSLPPVLPACLVSTRRDPATCACTSCTCTCACACACSPTVINSLFRSRTCTGFIRWRSGFMERETAGPPHI